MAGFILVSRMFFMPFPDRLDRFFCFFLLLFLHFSVVCRQKKLCYSFIRIIRFRDFFASSGYFLSSAEKFFHPIPVFSVLFLNSFRRKSLFFSASASRFRAFFPHLSNHFRAFSRAVWKIFLSVSIIFPLFSELSGRKIHIFRNGFSVRLLSLEGNSSTIPVFGGFRSVFFLPVLCRLLPCFFQPYRHFSPFFCLSRLWKISCFPAFVRTFCMEPTRAHSHARNNILSTLSGFLFLLPQDMP